MRDDLVDNDGLPLPPVHTTDEAQELVAKRDKAIADWRQPWMDDEWLAWWKGLNHGGCSQYIDAVDFEVAKLLPGYVKCHSMHCPDCGKSTGGQGHMNCPVREANKAKENQDG
jgi:hypothetical protein